ncbi:M12 family metallo-peptidase [Mesonia sp. K7]|uniref:M12 family metallo-peptidase n=1 Tax=Mesonia sp. K7 TaxID=2218606 RepID=UPI000DA7A362|nr:M12 family metallo-peptidase [Mesonia sp. K7]PZD78425.1 hypothetical protein DNG35_05010 [Mesonia sp. K7]
MRKLAFLSTCCFLLLFIHACTTDYLDEKGENLNAEGRTSAEGSIQNSLDEFLGNYEVVEIDAARILEYTLNQGKENTFLLDLQMESHPGWIFNVDFIEVYDENYKAYESDESGNWIEVAPGRSDTYHGDSRDRKANAIFSVNDHYFSGLIFEGTDEYIIDPVSLYVRGASPNSYVIYKSGDDLTERTLFCDNRDFEPTRDIGNTENRQMANCRELSISYVADYHYYLNRGNSNTTTTRNFINDRVKFASYRYWSYNDYPLYFWLFSSAVRTNTTNQPSSATNTSDALSQFRSWGQAGNMSVGDANILFAGRNFGSAFGRAYTSTTCKTSGGKRTAYAIVTNSSSASSSSVWNKVVAHEVGHNLSASHTTTGFMKQGDHSNSAMASTTVTELNNYIAGNNGCMPLKTCVGWR